MYRDFITIRHDYTGWFPCYMRYMPIWKSYEVYIRGLEHLEGSIGRKSIIEIAKKWANAYNLRIIL